MLTYRRDRDKRRHFGDRGFKDERVPDDFISGFHVVAEALRAGGYVQRLYIARESKTPGTQSLVDLARAAQVPFDFVPQAKLNELAETHEHQGAVARISPVAYTPLKSCVSKCGPRALLLALDQIRHPKNLGMLIRTAAGAGASGVLFPTRASAQPSAEVLRASAGTLFRVPLVSCPNMGTALRALKDAGFWIHGLAADAPESVFDVRWAERTVIVIGNETSGLRPGTRKACDAMVRIPLAEGVESLNAAVAAGIALFQVSRTAKAASPSQSK